MNAENTMYLTETYPILYRDRNRPMQQSLMCFGFEHGDGWFKLIDELSKKLEMLNNEPACPYYIIAVQVKEKFGGLRFYTHLERKEGRAEFDTLTDEEKASERLWGDIMWDLADKAESQSEWTCEECGDRGETYRDGWHRTLCPYHRAHDENRRFYRKEEE